jgi:hypothetical protein
MNPSPADPVIDEIRKIRHEISASCDHDLAKLAAHLMEYQRQFKDRLIYDPSEQIVSPQGVQLNVPTPSAFIPPTVK